MAFVCNILYNAAVQTSLFKLNQTSGSFPVNQKTCILMDTLSKDSDSPY